MRKGLVVNIGKIELLGLLGVVHLGHLNYANNINVKRMMVRNII